MPVQSDIPAGGVHAADQMVLGVLTQAVPPRLVDEVIEVAGCREQRSRLLPARVVIYFVLGLALFHAADGFKPPGYRAVMTILAGVGRVVASAAALTQARRRVGVKVFQLLFERVCAAAGQQQLGAPAWRYAFGRRVWAWDCAEIAVPDTAANAAGFGYHGQSRRRAAEPSPDYLRRLGSYPLVKVMKLIDCGSHQVIDAVFDGTAKASEQDLARRLVAALRPGTLLLADRNFAGYDLWGLAAGTGADLLWRVKSSVVFTPVEYLPDGSFLALMPTKAESRRCGSARRQGLRTQAPRAGHLIRVIEFRITVTAQDASTRTEDYRLITTLLDPQHAPAENLAALYHERWESENGYSFVKPRMIGTGNIIRSKSPAGVTQEIYAFLIVYQLLCQLRADTAAVDGRDPDQISFLVTIRAARASIHQCTACGWRTNRQDVIASIRTEPKLKRRNRTSPRQKRPSPATRKYPIRSRDHPTPTTQKVSYSLHIQPRTA